MPNFDSEKIGFLNFQVFPMIHEPTAQEHIDYTGISGDIELKFSN